MASAAYTPTASQWASAATHLENRDAWRTVRISGVRYISLVSGRSNRVYLARADAEACGCAWYQQTGRQCSHMLAIYLATTEDELRQEAAAQAASTPRARYDAIFPPCHVCGDLTDSRSKLCDRCAAEQTRRLETAEKMASVGTR